MAVAEEFWRYSLSVILIVGIIPSSSQITTSDFSADLGCYELTPPLFGALAYNGSWIGGGRPQPEWRANDTATFLCDRGYVLVDASGRSLGEQWNVTCVPSNADGSGSGAGSGNVSYNSTTGENVAWSPPPEQLTCFRIDCGPPQQISNGTVSLTTPNTTDLLSTAQYTCNAGYQLTDDDGGGGSDGGYSVCWWDGAWRPNFTSCDPILTCGDPPSISHGDYEWTTTGSQATSPVGTTVIYTCDAGYEREGGREVVCTDNEQWTQPPSCTATAALSSTEVYIVEGAGAGVIIVVLSLTVLSLTCYICRTRIRQRRYVEDEEALANSGAFTLSNPLVAVKDEDAAGNPLYLTPDELNEFEQQQ